MTKPRRALRLMLEAEVPGCAPADVSRLLDAKFRCVWAYQTFASLNASQMADVEAILLETGRTVGGCLVIAYLEQEGERWFSCLVEPDAEGRWRARDARGRLTPKYRIELPGRPILGNGKSDNQNCALPFTRGSILQAIDCNQEGYLEEWFKLPNALREFEGRGPREPPPPAIVGFREVIFSGLGSLGDFAASAELVFGTLVQRTMAYPLLSRYHYGHPDMFDKLGLIAQGGMSKATKNLNLSEDIFAGMDAQLRGKSIVHREYFQ
eukprot:386749-Prymnesium_polylepis.1